jgi:protein-disulfide isomerase
VLTGQQQSEFERWYTSLPRVPVAVPNDGAKVLIVKFNDYQCPPCRMTYESYKPIIAKYQGQYPGKVKFVTKDYPLEPECNSNAPSGQHLAACEAAVAVRLARAKKRGEAMEEWLFQNQAQMTPDLVREGVKGVAGVTDFDAQYASQLELVKGDIALGALLQVKGTPTFFVNGVRIPIVKPEFFDAAIAYELKH